MEELLEADGVCSFPCSSTHTSSDNFWSNKRETIFISGLLFLLRDKSKYKN